MTIHADGHFIEVFTPNHNSGGYFLSQTIEHYFSKEGATVNAMKLLCQSIKNQANTPITPAEIELGMKMLFGLAWSSLHDGRRISPNDVPNSFSILGKYQELYA